MFELTLDRTENFVKSIGKKTFDRSNALELLIASRDVFMRTIGNLFSKVACQFLAVFR